MRKSHSLALMVLFGSLSNGSVYANGCVAPLNEDCDGAIVFTTTDLPYEVTAPLGCFNDEVDKPYFDIFYRYDATVSGPHLVHMCDSSGDTYVRIYRDGCGWGSGVELATADDECPGSPPNADPLLTIDLQAGESYWFELGTWRDEPPWAPPPNSPYNFSVSLPGSPPQTTCDGTGLATSLIGEAGNSADTNGSGAVARLFRSGIHEVQNREYVLFLNRVAATDTNGLYDEGMTTSGRGGILRGGAPGSFTYWVKESFGDKPVVFASWIEAARYVNWLENGQPTGPQDATTTENGVYDLSVPPEEMTRSPGASFFIPTHDEWYKAAYFDPFDPGADANGTPDYWAYPTTADVSPGQATADSTGNVTNPGPNVANYGSGADWNGENGNVTTVGSSTSSSPWGLFDAGGNMLEWTETLDMPIDPDTPRRLTRGGDFFNAAILMSSGAGFALPMDMEVRSGNVGFRVAASLCLGDFDGDNDLDEDDRAGFESCFTGPDDGGPLTELCAVGDFDLDNDVDCADWSTFVEAWTGLDPPVDIDACGSLFSDGFETGDTSQWS